MAHGAIAFSPPGQYKRSISWVEAFFFGCLAFQSRSSYCWHFSHTDEVASSSLASASETENASTYDKARRPR